MPLKVNPNRMELLRLKRRLAVARRGHKLLEDKLEGLIQKFMEEVKNYKELREEISEKFLSFLSLGCFTYLRIPSFIWRDLVLINEGETLLREKIVKEMNIPVSILNIENVYVPKYSFIETPETLDHLVFRWKDLLEGLINLVNKERELLALSEEIEKTKRRVNALEYKLIPQIEETVKYITTKLEELERGNFIRLLRLKES
ncbi:MAG: V-type ATP synthase subunit D [Dictyoglomus sp.]|nr:V-type ATP synthase subunit D [Dictyoglomus sp.]MCX7942007.1 V-type ATP synthase subunit D [Dictyoglomaceae bacterium]MDW8188731.1 V-type ATP synthase subunit D [Dictyoglomus sp.]